LTDIYFAANVAAANRPFAAAIKQSPSGGFIRLARGSIVPLWGYPLAIPDNSDIDDTDDTDDIKTVDVVADFAANASIKCTVKVKKLKKYENRRQFTPSMPPSKSCCNNCNINNNCNIFNFYVSVSLWS